MADKPSRPSPIIPLFPLSRTVLLPLANLPLYIFEPRYKEMIRNCISESKPFGVLLLRPGSGESEREAASRMGGTGRILWHRVVKEGGEMVILVKGVRRFRVREYVDGAPYLQGSVEYLQQPWANPEEKDEQMGLLRIELDRLLSRDPPTLSKLADELHSIRDPGDLADAMVAGLPLEPEGKQTFLETLDPAVRVRRLTRLIAKNGFHLALLDRLHSGEPGQFQEN